MASILNNDNVIVTYVTTAVPTSSAGTYPITATISGSATGNYNLQVTPGTLTINPATLVVNVANATRTYGAANPAFTATYTGLMNGDTVAPTFSTTATTASPVGTYAITATLTGNANYTATVNPGTLTVTTAPLSFVVANMTKVYGTANPTLSGTITGLLNGDQLTPTYSTTALMGSGVGSYPITATLAGPALTNYSSTITPGSLTVTAAVLTITPTNETMNYGGPVPALTYSITGLVNGDAAGVVSGQAALTTTATSTSVVGSYPITATLGTLSAANYTFTFANGTLAVAAAPLTVVVNNATRNYGAANPICTSTITGLANGNTITPIYSTSATTASPVGSYAVTATVSGAVLANYNLTVTPGTLTVNAAPLTVNVNNATRAYGAANPVFTGTLTGLVNGDTVSAVYSSAATLLSGVGSYSITATLSGAALANYNPTINPGTLSITAAPLNIAINSATRSYGAGNPTFTGTATGLLNSDSVTTTYSTTATAASSVGSYPITATISGPAAANYMANVTPGTLTVTQATLTVTANNLSRQFNSANPALTYTITGFLNSDTTSGVSGSATLTTTATTTSAVGTYPITVATESLTATNYAFAYVGGTLAVTGGATQTITFNTLPNVTYGVAPITLAATASSGLPVSYTVTGPATVSGSTLTVTGAGSVTVTANQAGNTNYSAATAVAQSFTVAKAALTVTATNASIVYGQTIPTFTYTSTGFVNGDGSNVLSGAPVETTTATSTSQVGAYPITITQGTLTAANYTLSFANGTLIINGGAAQTITFGALPSKLRLRPITLAATASSGQPVTYTVTGPATLTGSTLTINGAGSVTVTANQAGNTDYAAATAVTQGFSVAKAALTVTAANLSRQYNAANPTLTYAITGFVNSDNTAVVSGTATLTTTATTTSAVGSYPITFATESLTASNYTFTYVPGTLTVSGGAAQTITFAPLPNVTYGAAPITLAATASSGLPVTYTVTGPATLSGSTLAITGAGSVSVTANQTGNTNYAAATAVTQSFTVAQVALTVTAANLSRQFNTANPTLTYAITGFVNGDGVNVVSGSATLATTAITSSAVGSYPITFATESLAASNYTFTYVPGTLTVTGGVAQSITFAPLPNVTYGSAPITLAATASSGLPVSYTVTGPATVAGSTLTITGAGAVSVTANQAGNTNYAAATSVTQSFTVAKAALTVTATNANITFGQAIPAFTYTSAGFVNGDSSIVLSGAPSETTTATTTSAVGTYPITITQGTLTASNYTFNFVNGTLTINGGATQTITFGALPNLTYGAAPITLAATASSGLPVSYTVTGPATLTGSTLAITGAGTVTVTANQAGNANYAAATSVARSFTVAKALLAVTASSTSIALGQAIPAFTYTAAGFVNGDSLGALSGTPVETTTATSTSPAGAYPITISQGTLAAANYAFSFINGTLTINTATGQTITFPALPAVTYGVAPITLAATASSGLPVSYTVTGPATLSGSTLTITGAGTVAVTATQAGNGSYGAASPVTRGFVVSKALLHIQAQNAYVTYGQTPAHQSHTAGHCR